MKTCCDKSPVSITAYVFAYAFLWVVLCFHLRIGFPKDSAAAGRTEDLELSGLIFILLLMRNSKEKGGGRNQGGIRADPELSVVQWSDHKVARGSNL